MKLLEIKPTSCRVAVCECSRVTPSCLVQLALELDHCLHLWMGKVMKINLKENNSWEEETMENTVYEQEFNLSKLEQQQQEMRNVCSQLST